MRPRSVQITCRISRSLADAIAARREVTGESLDHVLQAALAESLQMDHGTLFQVSTAGALVEGLSRGEISIATLREHGDFGLGTFDGLDGEMVALDGRFFRVDADGRIVPVDDGALTPYAMVTRFAPEASLALGSCADVSELRAKLDRVRRSDNHFYAVRVDGMFDEVRTRCVARRTESQRLAEAAATQREFTLRDVAGTLAGFWSPTYARALDVAGYHLHFLAADRTAGGHLLDCRGHDLHALLQHEADLRVSLPESESFLRADLTRDPSAALARAETGRD